MEKIQERAETLEVRLITKEDREEITSWWKDWNFSVIPEFLLPKRGYIVIDGEDKVCVSWLYLEADTAMSWMAWTVCNKSTSIEKRRKGLQFLIDRLKEESLKLGRKVIFTTTDNSSFKDRLVNSNFIKGDTSVDHYFYFGE